MTLSRKPLVLLFAPVLLLALACGGSPEAGDNADALTTDLSSDLTSDVTTTDLTSDPGGEGTPPAEQDFVRPNFKTLAPDGPEIAALRAGVQAMKARPITDPTSWAYQAAIHGTYDDADREAWNSCQHGSYFFLSWHRMYLYYFERILRKASGDPNFALPFWDYTDPTQRALPAVVRQPANAQNPLFVAERNPPANAGAQLPASAVAFNQAMNFTNFSSPAGSALSFGGQTAPGPQHFDSPHGQLESQPHDIIHVLVGGQDGWMSDPNTAAQDPIFWFHHANIDRLWAVWTAKAGDRQNPTDATWLNQKFVFFDENGQRIEMTGQQVVDTAQQLHYTYAEGSGDETGPQGGEIGELPAATFTDNRRDVLVDKAAPTRLTRDRASVSLQIPAAEPEAVGDEDRRLALVIEGIKFGRPGVYYEVYANLPQGTQPDPKGPHFVGNIAVFGQLSDGRSAHAGHARAGRVQQEDAALAFEVTALVERLRAREGFSGNLTLQFVPRGLEGAQARGGAGEVREVRFERIKLVRE